MTPTATQEKLYRTIQFDIKSIDETNRTFRAVASDSSLDRHGEMIDQNGWDLKNYLNNPVVLYGHDYYAPPVAKATEIGFDAEGRLVFTPQFATKDEYDFADTIWKLYKGGYMRAFSVGFIPKEMDGDTFKSMELLEISAVTVPSNPNALALAYKEGIIDDSERRTMIATHKNIIKSLTEVANNEEQQVKELQEQVEALAAQVKELTDQLATLKNDNPTVDEVTEADADVAAEDPTEDKPADAQADAGGAEEDVAQTVTPEDAEKIIAAAVERAVKASRGQID